MTMTKTEIISWLKETDENRLQELWKLADDTRRKYVGEEVHLRGLMEISNYCARDCAYCGINVKNKSVKRYRMAKDEIRNCLKLIKEFGYGTTVMQAGEDFGITKDWLTEIISMIKKEAGLAITLSLGERSEDDLAAWREAGADRFLLRFETSDSALFDRIHPNSPNGLKGRLDTLKLLQKLGYEAGSGVMVGIPGQAYESLADDIILFREMNLDMIGIGPYIPHPDTQLWDDYIVSKGKPGQVPATELMTCKAVALTRINCPDINLPSTTALGVINTKTGRVNGLERGANVLMPNMTPYKYRQLYEIYPNKAPKEELPDEIHKATIEMLDSIGRIPGRGHGNRVGK